MGRTESGFGVNPFTGVAVLKPGVRLHGGTGAAHHGDVEDVKQVKRQSSNKVDKEPGGQVVEANGTRSRDHLAGLGHIGGAEVQDDICGGKRLLLGLSWPRNSDQGAKELGKLGTSLGDPGWS